MASAGGEPEEEREQERNERGLFDVIYRDQPLLEVVGQVARAIRPEQPEKISQPLWNEKRETVGADLEYPDLPTASAIYQRFNRPGERRRVEKLTWARIIELGLEAAAGRDQTKRLAVGAGAQEDNFDVRHLWFGMRLIALDLNQGGLTQGDYTRTYKKLTERRKRGRQGTDLIKTLPTLDQVLDIAERELEREGKKAKQGDGQRRSEREVWAKAHQLAGLKMPARSGGTAKKGNTYKPKGEPINRVLAIYLDANPDAEHFPSEITLRRFAKQVPTTTGKRLTVGDRDRDENGARKSYLEHIEEVRAERAERGLTTPANPKRAGRNTPPPVYNLPTEPVEPTHGFGGDVTNDRIYEVLQEYERGLPPNVRGSRTHYQMHRKTGWPSASTIDRHGPGGKKGWKPFWDEAKRRNQEQRLAKRRQPAGEASTTAEA